MDMVLISLLMVISTLVSIMKAFLKAMDNTNGKMEIFIVETLRKDLNMAKENGNKNHKILMNLINSTNSKVITFTIWNMDMDALHGKQEINTLVILKMIKEMDGVLWSGLMKVFTKVNGSTVFNKALESWFQQGIKLLMISLVQHIVKKVC